MKTFLTVLALLLCNMAQAKDIPQIFPNLKKCVVGYTGITVWYNGNLTTLLDNPEKDRKKAETSDVIVRPIRSKLLGEKGNGFVVECDSGPSADPQCSIYEVRDGAEIKVFSQLGDEFIFPGNGNVYAVVRSDAMFETRKKYVYRNDKFEEVVQPFYYVGIDSKLNKDVILFSSPTEGIEVAQLPKGSPVMVLLNQGEHYLIKTPFGLTGWVRIPFGIGLQGSPENLINEIYFHGD